MKTATKSRRSRIAAPAANLFEEMFVDWFAGGGGASKGYEMATGRCVDVAINHDAAAIAMHTANHPNTRHIRDDVFHVDLIDASGRRKVGGAWYSPDCRHFSRAKGKKPVLKHIRGLAWVVVKSAKIHSPRILFLENVREFMDWGPVEHLRGTKPSAHEILTTSLTGRDLEKFKRGFKYTANGEPVMMPIKGREGETFRRFIRELRALGYVVEWRVLNCADYGAPTHRRRLFLVARRDGLPIVWPKPTHGPNGKLPYRTAAEFIDWFEPCPSILLTKEEAEHLRKTTGIRCNRPLAKKTRWRAAQGMMRFLLEHPEPFVAPGEYVNTGDFIVRVDHGGNHFRGQPVTQPLQTITGHHGYGLVSPTLVGTGGASYSAKPRTPAEPASSVLPNDRRAVVSTYMTRICQNGSEGTNTSDVRKPLTTITSKNEHCQTAAYLTSFHHSKSNESRCTHPEQPINTVDTSNRHGLVAVSLIGVGGRAGQSPPTTANAPLGTTTAKADRAVVVANMIQLNHGNKQWYAADEPLRTIPSQGNKFGVVYSHIVKYFGTGGGSCPSDPLHTITGKPRFGLVEVGTAPGFVLTDFELGRAKRLAKFMREEVGEAVGKHLIWVDPGDGGEAFPLVVAIVRGEPHIVVDICLRMLKPRELARCQGFPEDYILTGTQANQVARIGNSVPPQVVEALIRANYLEN